MPHEARSDDVPGAPDGIGQNRALGLRRWRSALYGTAAALWFAAPAAAQPLTPQQVLNLQQEIRAQQQQIKHEQRQLYLESLRLDDQQRLLDTELGKLRGTGPGATAAAAPLPPSPLAPPAAPPPAPGETPQANPPRAEQAAAPISGPSASQRETRRVLETAHELSSKGGVLTPEGVLVVDPSLEYDYWNQNQVSISGFTIIPGITFGNINVQRVQANYVTTALTFRYGVTNRFEINLKLPFIYATGSTITQPLGPNAQIFSPHADALGIGDVQGGASYQLNSGEHGWPVFIANVLFKSATGTSPFDVPIYTTNDPNGLYIAGIQKKLPTGTGFDTLEPSITMLIPTSPAVLFANIAYGVNFARGVEIANRSGGAPTPATIGPGNFISGTFGVGFAVNDQTSMTFSYQQEHVWPTTEDGVAVAGSSFDFGTFNFGLGFAINRNITVNIGAGIGVGPNNPVAKIVIEVPIRLAI